MPILNRNKVTVPDIFGTGSIEYTRIIKIDPETGLFSASVPDHLQDTARLVAPSQSIADEDGPERKIPAINYQDNGKFKGEVVANSRDVVVDQWQSLIYRCQQFLITHAKVKVILLRTEMNVRIADKDGKLVFIRDDVSFAKTSPLVGVDFTVCHQAEKHLVDDENKRIRESENSVVIPHTPGREAFLQNIVDTFERAALQLHEFMMLVKEDPLQIEGVMTKGYLLENNK